MPVAHATDGEKQHSSDDCDYVETNRRETAIRFVVDAFNGKVDSSCLGSKTTTSAPPSKRSAMPSVWSITTEQHSEARASRTRLPEARLTELRWAATVQELKLRDREEQRRIKEQIREEERAQREFEALDARSREGRRDAAQRRWKKCKARSKKAE